MLRYDLSIAKNDEDRCIIQYLIEILKKIFIWDYR